MYSSSDIITRSPRIAQRLFEERMLVISVDDSKLHRFNEVATFIWRQLETPKNIGEISEMVCRHFTGCTRATALRDVAAFAEKMAEKDLVTVTCAHESRKLS